MKSLLVKPGSQVKLAAVDPGDSGADKEKTIKKTVKRVKELGYLQELLYAEHQHKVLIVLQAMDTGGKDGVIRHVFDGINPQGVRVAGFKKPTPLEMDHDYLWRVHTLAPAAGEMVIFNRSHYEDVLVVAVHNLVSKKIWSRRYEQINQFEKMLTEEGTVILKFYLHIDADEQKKRLQDRLDDPQKRWKFNPADLEERKLWSAYMKAYESVLQKTNTAWAPWYIIPANKKWYRNYLVAEIIVEALKKLSMRYPEPEYDPTAIVIP